jgi:hypothetical protein
MITLDAQLIWMIYLDVFNLIGYPRSVVSSVNPSRH